MNNIVIIDDEQIIRDSLKQLFELEGYQVECFASASVALSRINRRFEGVIVCDINMPQMDGLSFLASVKQFDSELPVVFLTGFGDVGIAVKAMQMGAYDFFEKPVSEPLLDCLQRALEKRRLVMENRALKKTLASKSAPGVRILGNTHLMKAMIEQLDAIVDTPVDVLIEGETGTGKELVARYLHDHSPRSEAHFVAINCGAVPLELIESELFGIKRGAFTDAKENRVGKFEYAQDGTLFLDEIEAMPPSMQVKLLRVLEERRVTPVGSNDAIELDVRIVAATKVDLQCLVDSGDFRADLYYRLNLVKIPIPALRHRKDDIPILFKHFSSIAANRFHRTFEPLSPGLMHKLREYNWPGNVRELRNVAERSVLLGQQNALQHSSNANDDFSIDLSLAEKVNFYEQSLIEEALSRTQGSIKSTMDILQLPRKTLYDKMTKYGLSRARFTDTQEGE